jgi:hypothetical protein
LRHTLGARHNAKGVRDKSGIGSGLFKTGVQISGNVSVRFEVFCRIPLGEFDGHFISFSSRANFNAALMSLSWLLLSPPLRFAIPKVAQFGTVNARLNAKTAFGAFQRFKPLIKSLSRENCGHDLVYPKMYDYRWRRWIPACAGMTRGRRE